MDVQGAVGRGVSAERTQPAFSAGLCPWVAARCRRVIVVFARLGWWRRLACAHRASSGIFLRGRARCGKSPRVFRASSGGVSCPFMAYPDASRRKRPPSALATPSTAWYIICPRSQLRYSVHSSPSFYEWHNLQILSWPTYQLPLSLHHARRCPLDMSRTSLANDSGFQAVS